MEKQNLQKKAVDYAALFYPKITREELVKRITLGEATHKEKLATVGVEHRLSEEELKNVEMFLRYELYRTASSDEIEFLESQGVKPQRMAWDPEVDDRTVNDFMKDLDDPDDPDDDEFEPIGDAPTVPKATN
jgi:hypothetical protein